MSNNKYKDKLNKEKDKCNKLITKLYGDNFYFMHTIKYDGLNQILKDNKLKISSNTKETHFGDLKYGNNRPPYLYCIAQFNDMINLNKYNNSWPILILHPKIFFENKIIFNKSWIGTPIKDTKGDIYLDSIYINKHNTYDEKIIQLKTIKNIIKETAIKYKDYNRSHEFLFTKDINIKDNLLGILCLIKEEIPNINKILKKYEYNNIKIFSKIKDIPSLCDLLSLV
jgi:hypothetical protein